MIKKNFLLYLIPMVALVVGVIQWSLVETTLLSRWKGGGFGMYTELHPNVARTSWVSFQVNNKSYKMRGKDIKEALKESQIFGPRTDLAISHLYNNLKDLRYYPNAESIKDAIFLFKKLYKAAGLEITNLCIEVTELSLNIKEKSYNNNSLITLCENEI
ncbi:hypothetical protein [Halobacteriovorax sp. JY17]|uniref:hypothetical protein n=1 Tax=Halobacteriovorax sp. JY17 TaxID=2014617 RepID=UPI000C4649CA|nr:hypothetical protein [Halobacteriovorax sp. JY17]PIK14204.1 MAG: hypothetical protein CES88_14600 [Halobacteriovorax sp. JY17]